MAPALMRLVLPAALRLFLQVQATLDVLPAPARCFEGALPGTVDRSSAVIRLARRGWVSHDLSTYVTYTILKEFLGYDAKLMDASGRSTSAWGPDMVADDFDLDMEQWQISSSAFRDYVTRDQVVIDFGPIGYPGRGGMFLANGPVALAVDQYADYYITFQDAAKAIATGLDKFGDIDMQTLTAAEYPVCKESDWCGSGDFTGYWVPPQCSNVGTSPSDCIEAVMMRPSWDSGYFEQLTLNLGLKIVHGYYGAAHNDLVKDKVAAGKPVLFYWYTPDPLVPGSNSVRLSYPDFYVGCANGDTRKPDGPVACDYPELTMLKLGHSRLKAMPEAMYFLKRLELLTADIEGIMANHTSTNGPYNTEQAACAWIKSNMDKVQSFAPDCIVKPPANPVTGDFIFDKDKLECVQTTVYDIFPSPPVCLDAAYLGWKDRSDITIKVGVRNWLSQSLGTVLAGTILKDVLRYNVEFVDLSPSSTSAWGPEISDGLWHFDAEQWQAPPDGNLYKQYVKDDKTVIDLGEIGYGGRGAIFTFKKTVDSLPASGFYKYFKDSATPFADGFPRWGEVDMQAHFTNNPGGGVFPMCTPAIMSWCQVGQFEGYWAPPQCQANPTDCVEFFMASPTYDTAYFEQLTRNLGLKVIHGYYGWNMGALIKERFASDKPTMFYWYEPDPLPPSVGAMRLSYPDFSYGCDRSHNRNADTGGLECDYPETKLRKLGSAILPQTAPEAYFFLSNFIIMKGDIEAMMSGHKDGGGDPNTDTFQAACNFLKANREQLSSAFPDCIAYPKALGDIKIMDDVFDPDNFVCKAMTCPSHQILTVDASLNRIFCQDPPPGLVPNADQTQAEFCEKGFAVSADRTSCTACPPGSFAENRGQTACMPCPKGTFVDVDGATACELCDKGFWQDVPGTVVCKACTNGMTTDSRGMFTADSCQCPENSYLSLGGSCEACPEGMTCDFGSKVANIQLFPKDRTLPIPKVKPGYFTKASEPLSVYLCDDMNTARCPGGLPDVCSGGLEGLVCEACPDGEALQDGVCTKCDAGPSTLVFFVLPVGLCILALVMFKVANDKVTVNVGNPLMLSVLIGLVVTTLQTLALFPGLSVKWRAQGDIFGSFKFFLGSPDGVPLACALSGSPVVLYLFRCLLPVLCVVAVFVVWGMSRAAARARGQEGWNLNIAINTLGQLLQTLFIAIAVLVAQPMRCYGHPNGSSSMTSFPQVLCWEDDDHIVLVLLGVLIGVFFVLPFIASCVLAVIQAPKAKDAVGHYQRWRFLLYRFRADVWWWGIVFLLRQMILAFSTCVPADSPQWQITYVGVVTAAYMCVVCAKWPWKNAMLNYIDVCSMIVINYIIISAGGFAGVNDEDIGSFVAFHFVVFFVFAAFILYVIGTTLYWARARGIRGAYGSSAKVETTAKAWCDFVKVSASLDQQILRTCITTFTEFDIQHLVKAMGSFQSLDSSFGDRLAPRLRSISHSSSDIDALAGAVRKDREGKLQENVQVGQTLVVI